MTPDPGWIIDQVFCESCRRFHDLFATEQPPRIRQTMSESRNTVRTQQTRNCAVGFSLSRVQHAPDARNRVLDSAVLSAVGATGGPRCDAKPQYLALFFGEECAEPIANGHSNWDHENVSLIPCTLIVCDSSINLCKAFAMAIAVKCSCGRSLKVADHVAGKRVRCPNCQDLIAVPKQIPVEKQSPPASLSPKEKDEALAELVNSLKAICEQANSAQTPAAAAWKSAVALLVGFLSYGVGTLLAAVPFFMGLWLDGFTQNESWGPLFIVIGLLPSGLLMLVLPFLLPIWVYPRFLKLITSRPREIETLLARLKAEFPDFDREVGGVVVALVQCRLQLMPRPIFLAMSEHGVRRQRMTKLGNHHEFYQSIQRREEKARWEEERRRMDDMV